MAAHLSSSHLFSIHLNSSQRISAHLSSSQLISTHLNSSELISAHLNSSQLISTLFNSSQLIWNHLNSSEMISTHPNSTQLIWKQLVKSHQQVTFLKIFFVEIGPLTNLSYILYIQHTNISKFEPQRVPETRGDRLLPSGNRFRRCDVKRRKHPASLEREQDKYATERESYRQEGF